MVCLYQSQALCPSLPPIPFLIKNTFTIIHVEMTMGLPIFLSLDRNPWAMRWGSLPFFSQCIGTLSAIFHISESSKSRRAIVFLSREKDRKRENKKDFTISHIPPKRQNFQNPSFYIKIVNPMQDHTSFVKKHRSRKPHFSTSTKLFWATLFLKPEFVNEFHHVTFKMAHSYRSRNILLQS